MDILFGTKIYNHKTKEVGLLIKTWVNKFADGDVDYATCVDTKGKGYNTPLENITPLDEMENKLSVMRIDCYQKQGKINKKLI